MKNLVPVLAAAALLLLATGQEAEAQLGVDFGPEVSYNSESENFGVGARLEISPMAVPIGFIASGEYVFCDAPGSVEDLSCSIWEFGASAKYTIGLPGAPVGPYVGGGLTHQRATFDLEIPGADDTATNSGLHLLGGIGLGGLSPIGAFLEGRFAFLEENQFTIVAGILF